MANKETVRKLPIKAIKNDYDRYSETVEVEFNEDDGKTYRVTLSPYFKPSKVNEMLDKFGKDLNDISNSEIDFPDKLVPTYVIYNILLTFSDFPRPKTDDIKKKVSYFSQVINTKYFKEVTDHMIQEEISKVWTKLMEVLKENEKLERLIAKTQNEMQNLDLKSPELRAKLQQIQE